jgi:hypothetical protein
MKTINSTFRIVIEEPVDFAQLYKYLEFYWERKRYHKKINILITSKIKFVRPAEILIIVQFVIALTDNCDVTIYSEAHINRYFQNICISEFCDKNYEQSKTLNAIMSINAMPIRRVTRENMDEYIDYAKKYFQEICGNKDLTAFNIYFAELINNVYDHSESKIDAYVFCQYFPKINTIKIAVSDLGIGIPGSIRKAQIEGIELNNDQSCLKWAIKPSNSIKSMPSNRGLGLSNVIDFAKTNKGNLVLLSGNSKVLVIDGEVVSGKNPYKNFIGTLIQIELVINNLQIIDDEFIEYEY